MTMAARAWVERGELCLRWCTRVVAWLLVETGFRCEEWSRAINCGAAGTSSVRAVVVLRTIDQQCVVQRTSNKAHNTRGDKASVERRASWQTEHMMPCSRRRDIGYSRSESDGAAGLQEFRDEKGLELSHAYDLWMQVRGAEPVQSKVTIQTATDEHGQD